tara:strand:+ start:251 stop:640 length:390 start_codon:yes stop_codon:yes gene_type:complete
MSESIKGLSAVYTQLQGHYYLIHFINNHGSVDAEIAWTIFDELFGRRESIYPQYFGPFNGLDDVTKFCFRICDEASEPQVNLMSLEDFNEVLEASSTVEVLRQRLPTLGTIIANPDADNKKGLFGKLFN